MALNRHKGILVRFSGEGRGGGVQTQNCFLLQKCKRGDTVLICDICIYNVYILEEPGVVFLPHFLFLSNTTRKAEMNITQYVRVFSHPHEAKHDTYIQYTFYNYLWLHFNKFLKGFLHILSGTSRNGCLKIQLWGACFIETVPHVFTKTIHIQALH